MPGTDARPSFERALTEAVGQLERELRINGEDLTIVTIHLDGPGVTIDDVVAVARRGEPVELTDSAIERMAASRAIVDRLAEGEPKYGISTGFGALATVSIPPDRRRALQTALVRSHAAGMGAPGRGRGRASDGVPAGPHARARLQRCPTARRPGDGRHPQRRHLADRARIRLARGERRSRPARPRCARPARRGRRRVSRRAVRPAADALRDAGLEPIELAEKEGLAVTNGTDAILGHAVPRRRRHRNGCSHRPT